MKYNSELQATDLSFSFGERKIWSHLNFSLTPGNALYITGESGSGKTTLLQCAGSLIPPTSGKIYCDGVDISRLQGKSQRIFLRNSVSFVFQNSNLVPSWSLQKNLELGGPSTQKNTQETHRILKEFGLNPQLISQPAYNLSGGEQQRTALVRAALRQTPLLIFDEPTAALDDTNALLVSDFIENHLSLGGIALVATHDSRLLKRAEHLLRLS